MFKDKNNRIIHQLNIEQKKYNIDPNLFGNNKKKPEDRKPLSKDYDYFIVPYTEMELATRRPGNKKTAHVLLMKKSNVKQMAITAGADALENLIKLRNLQ